MEGRALHNVQNAMFAAAMAFSLGIKLDAIRQGLRTFDTTFFQAPGRMNVFDEHPFKVIFDYGHNAHAVGAMADLAQRLDVHGPAHRGDGRARRPPRRGHRARSPTPSPGASTTTSAAATIGLRGRDGDEVPRMLRRTALEAAGVAPAQITLIPDEQEAIDAALRMGRPGDLVLIFADALMRSWKQVIKFRPEGAPAARLPEAPPALPEPAFAAAEESSLRPRRAGARRARRASRPRGGRLSTVEPGVFDSSRRLTGHNLYFAGTGAVLEVRAASPGQLRAWRERVEGMRAALGWSDDGAIVAHEYAGGAALALAAPRERLFVATELNEWAWLGAADAALAAPLPFAPRIRKCMTLIRRAKRCAGWRRRRRGRRWMRWWPRRGGGGCRCMRMMRR